MQRDQDVSDMADEVLLRQARARAAQTGERLEEALAAILETEAGQRLRNLREGPYRDESANDWQKDIVRERETERVERKDPRT